MSKHAAVTLQALGVKEKALFQANQLILSRNSSVNLALPMLILLNPIFVAQGHFVNSGFALSNYQTSRSYEKILELFDDYKITLTHVMELSKPLTFEKTEDNIESHPYIDFWLGIQNIKSHV